MVKVFSVASWNVKHFSKEENKPADQDRVNRVISFLKEQDPDVFGLYEVEGKDVFNEIVVKFPNYVFQITEGPQAQEILVGIRNNFTAFFTQKLDFKSGVTLMRPGLLATITVDGTDYCLLFLHLASMTEPRGMGLRDDMFERALKFRKTLDGASRDHQPANYIFLGDLNTMGMDYPFKKNIEANIELKKYDEDAKKYDIVRLKKTNEETWYGSSTKKSNLDHVYASNQIKFRQFKNSLNEDVNIDIRGWVQETTAKNIKNWVKNYSDHSLIYFEVEK